MSIYDVNGNQLSNAYTVDGTSQRIAYDNEGQIVFTAHQNIKVMTYNVGTWYYGGHDNVPADKDEEYYELQNGMIQQNDPDILCMNEYCKEFSKTGRTALSMLQQYFPYIHEQGGDNPSAANANGRCIASKYPISNYTVRNFSDNSGLYYDSCTININGTQLTVVVTHLLYDASDASKRISEIYTVGDFLLSQQLAIACGDMNTLDSKTTSGQDYQDMIVPLLNAGLHVANCGNFGFKITYSDQPNGTWTGCLDNIITTSNITIDSVYVDETKLTDGLTERTDHMPLIATLTI